MFVTLNECYLRAANRGFITSQPLMKRISFFFWCFTFFETADLRSYCGYFLAICQLCFLLLLKVVCSYSFSSVGLFYMIFVEAIIRSDRFYDRPRNNR